MRAEVISIVQILLAKVYEVLQIHRVSLVHSLSELGHTYVLDFHLGIFFPVLFFFKTYGLSEAAYSSGNNDLLSELHFSLFSFVCITTFDQSRPYIASWLFNKSDSGQRAYYWVLVFLANQLLNFQPFSHHLSF